VAIKPKPPFAPIFQVAIMRERAGIKLVNEPQEITPEAQNCFWWRRGRIELYLKQSEVIRYN